MPGARYVKCFNTLTSGFQVEAAHRDPPAVQWPCGDDDGAKALVARRPADPAHAELRRRVARRATIAEASGRATLSLGVAALALLHSSQLRRRRQAIG